MGRGQGQGWVKAGEWLQGGGPLGAVNPPPSRAGINSAHPLPSPRLPPPRAPHPKQHQSQRLGLVRMGSWSASAWLMSIKSQEPPAPHPGLRSKPFPRRHKSAGPGPPLTSCSEQAAGSWILFQAGAQPTEVRSQQGLGPPEHPVAPQRPALLKKSQVSVLGGPEGPHCVLGALLPLRPQSCSQRPLSGRTRILTANIWVQETPEEQMSSPPLIPFTQRAF